jgi:hypothetical protein
MSFAWLNSWSHFRSATAILDREILGGAMQVIDVGAMGVRSAVLRCTRAATPLRFTIYPMVHLGEPAFYADISRRLRGHDLIVAEGIQGADRSVRNLTRAYRLAGGERLGLVVQTREMLDVGVPVLFADMTGEDFGRRWREIPLAERVVVGSAVPLFAIYQRVFGSRETLARHLRLDDDTAIDSWNPDSGLEKLVCDRREALLVGTLVDIYAQRRDEPIDVAIVYGAAHALPVVRYLMAALGYVARAAEWVRVFDY